MMGPRQEAQAALFHEFSLDDHVPHGHLQCSFDPLLTRTLSVRTSKTSTATLTACLSTLNC